MNRSVLVCVLVVASIESAFADKGTDTDKHPPSELESEIRPREVARRHVQDALVSFRGIYRIRMLTRSVGDCTAKGTSVTDKQPEQLFVIADGLIFCSTISECRTAAATDEAPQKTAPFERVVMSMPYRFNELQGHTLTGHVDEVWKLDANTCGARFSTVSLAADGSDVVFERRTVHVTAPADPDGICFAGDDRELEAKKPCDLRYAMRGTRIGSL